MRTGSPEQESIVSCSGGRSGSLNHSIDRPEKDRRSCHSAVSIGGERRDLKAFVLWETTLTVPQRAGVHTFLSPS